MASETYDLISSDEVDTILSDFERISEMCRYEGFDVETFRIFAKTKLTMSEIARALVIYLHIGGGFTTRKLARRPQQLSDELNAMGIKGKVTAIGSSTAGSRNEELTLSRLAVAFPEIIIILRHKNQGSVNTFSVDHKTDWVFADPCLAGYTKTKNASLPIAVAKAQAKLYMFDKPEQSLVWLERLAPYNSDLIGLIEVAIKRFKVKPLTEEK